MYYVVLWVNCGYLVEWWLSCGHMYVTVPFMYKHSDITYSAILMPSLSKKSLFDTATLYIAISGLLVVFLAKLFILT